MSKNSNNNTNNDEDERALYDRWRALCVTKLKDKLELNIAKRKKNFQDVVTSAAHKILRDNTLEIIATPPDFRVSCTITTEALDRMCQEIQSWPGVHLSQCKKLPPIFKKYWRIADNWWNRQKGKWFGDLFFWPILNYSLHQYCKKILINKQNKVEYDYLYYIFLFDILHSKVSFKKARPNPLIFDLALEKSPKLQQWFSIAGDQHGIVWEITSKTTKKSIKDYAQGWVGAVRDRKYNLYLRFKSCNDYNVIPSITEPLNNNNNNMLRDVKLVIKRNSDSRKSTHSLSSNSNKDDSKELDSDMDSDKDNENNNNNNNNQTRTKSEVEYYMAQCAQLTQALAAEQQKKQQMAQRLSEMQMNQYMKDQYMMYNQQINEAQIMQAMHQIEAMQNNNNTYMKPYIKEENTNMYNTDEKAQYQYQYQYPMLDPAGPGAASINQPVFLPQPRVSWSNHNHNHNNITPEPAICGNILPPPLKTDAGKERRQSYHEVLKMKPYLSNDIKPESVHSTNHSTLTTASHTTVVSNMHNNNMNSNNRQHTPNTVVSTPSGSDVSSVAATYGGKTAFTYNGSHGGNYYAHNAMAALPQLQIYNPHNGYHYQHNNSVPVPVPVRAHYHLPPPIQPNILHHNNYNNPVSPIPKQSLLPPPPNSGSRRNSQISHQSHASYASHQSLSAQSQAQSQSQASNAGNITPPNINTHPQVHSANNSFDMLNSQFAVNDNVMDNNYNNIAVPFDTDMMDVNMDNILQLNMNNLSGSNMAIGPQMSGSNLSLNNFGFSDSNPNFMMNSVTNMSVSYNGGMSVENNEQ